MLVAAITGIALLAPATAPSTTWSGPGVSRAAGPLSHLRASSPASTTVWLAQADLEAGAEGVRALYLEGSFDAAVEAADVLHQRFLADAAFSTERAAWDAWANAMVTKAMALSRLDRAADADAAMRQVAIARPTWAPDKAFVPPRQQARFDEIRDGLLAGATIPITFTVAAGVEAQPVLDGRAIPAGVSVDVLPGPHFVGAAGVGRVVEVTGPATIPVGPEPVADTTPPADSITEEDGPWLWVGLGVGAVVVVAGATAGVVYALSQGEAAPNPGGTTISLDASRFRQRGTE